MLLSLRFLGNCILSFCWDSLIEDLSQVSDWSGLFALVEKTIDQLKIPKAIYVFMPRKHLYEKSSIQCYTWNYNQDDPAINQLKNFLELPEKIAFMSTRDKDMLRPFFGFNLPTKKKSVEGWPRKQNIYQKFSYFSGLVVPLVAYGNHEGFFALSVQEHSSPANFPRKLQIICQAFHQRYCELHADSLVTDINFSQREIELMMWIILGKPHTFIAQAMGISKNTVNSYIRSVFLKLGVRNKVAAAVKITELGLLHSHYPNLRSPEATVLELESGEDDQMN